MQYNNGLVEGSVNKIKVIKSVMYFRRNSFELLNAKVLLNEYFYTKSTESGKNRLRAYDFAIALMVVVALAGVMKMLERKMPK